jgi:tRNA pseudouridine55 synthase
MTSHDVVSRVRRLAGTRRVGHAGTLDPMATGVLIIGVEQATRLLGHLALTAKEYQATIRLGQATSTDDAEGEPAGGSTAAAVTSEAVAAAIGPLTGEIMQVPPGVSAIKVNGQRAYKLTRAGEAPELKPRPVTVYEFRLAGERRAGDFLDLDATIRCSSGTYIRALARDLGAALGTGGHLTALRRTAVGAYGIGQARTLDDLAGSYDVTPLADAAAAAFPAVRLTQDQAQRMAHGAQLELRELDVPAAGGDPLAAFAPDGSLVALASVESGRLRSLAVFGAAG